MNPKLDNVLKRIQDKHHHNIFSPSRHYMEVDIGKEAEEMGYGDLKDKYHKVYAVIPLKESVRGMKVRIDGRTFVNYVQFESGIAVPGYVARDSTLPHKAYAPQDSLICNFT